MDRNGKQPQILKHLILCKFDSSASELIGSVPLASGWLVTTFGSSSNSDARKPLSSLFELLERSWHSGMISSEYEPMNEDAIIECSAYALSPSLSSSTVEQPRHSWMLIFSDSESMDKVKSWQILSTIVACWDVGHSSPASWPYIM
ncbi:hypothetical protein TorRG33x02_345820 [Trema orientale]|uniref:Uncharacterized protein n=1 Tax=Trema orientale TaxID=63057 RepID=A0A2P5ANK6_TREOI|nr:hypothetical protein TorRG33x02_345820 [Trema orientale]